MSLGTDLTLAPPLLALRRPPSRFKHAPRVVRGAGDHSQRSAASYVALVTTHYPQISHGCPHAKARMGYSSIMRNNEAQSLADFLRSNPHTLTRLIIEERWSRSALRAGVNCGVVTRVLPQHYAATEHADSTFTRSYAATSWVGHGSIALGATAASAWELCADPLSVTVSAPPGMSRSVPPWLTLRRTEDRAASALWHGCAVALPALAVVTAYGHLDRDQADGMVYSAIQRRLADAAEIASSVATMSGVRGRRALLSTLAAVDAGSESHLETVGLRSVFHTKDFAGFIRQHRLNVGGTPYRLDMYHPATRTAVELDGAAHHAGDANRARDVARDVTLSSVGIATLRFTYRDLTTRAPWCREMVRRTLRERVSR